ncbi:hypothetical protein Tco_1031975 [Tanacetum coccineum]|uniref:Transposase n=1 Tax=Tanacetum coccineum TaxID=301880 RepID=A0ABQ5GBB1_9ASTR
MCLIMPMQIFQEDGPQDPYRKCCYHRGARFTLHGKYGVKEIDLRPIRGWVARKYLLAGVGRDQQLSPGYPGRMPRHGRSHCATWVRLLKKATTKIARRDQRIQARKGEIKRLDQEIKSLRTVEAKVHDLRNRTKNLEILLEAKVDMKKAAEAKNAGQDKELESLRVQFLDLQELYPHMLTAIAGRRWVIRHGLRLAFMKCAESLELRQAFANVVSAWLVKGMSEGLEHGIEHGKADRDLAAVEAYDPEANSKYVKALKDLKDLKYQLVDQLEKLKDAPMEWINWRN